MLTPAELAAHLRTSERTIARMVAQGCPSILVGKRRRFDLAAVIPWAEQQAVCQSNNFPVERGTYLSASIVNDFTAACRKVQLRVQPSNTRPTFDQRLGNEARLSPVIQD